VIRLWNSCEKTFFNKDHIPYLTITLQTDYFTDKESVSPRPVFPRGIENIGKVLIFKISFKDLKSIDIGQNMHLSIEKVWKLNLKYLSRILLKSKQCIMYAVLCNV